MNSFHIVQEEERLKQEMTKSAHVVSTFKDKGKRKRTEEPKNEAAKGPTQKKQNQGDNCFFCSQPRHVKKKCTKYHAWCAKKGMFLTLVCSEVNLASVPRNTWWLASGVMQSYPARALDRRLQEDWAKDAREGLRVLISLRVDFGLMG